MQSHGAYRADRWWQCELPLLIIAANVAWLSVKLFHYPLLIWRSPAIIAPCDSSILCLFHGFGQ